MVGRKRNPRLGGIKKTRTGGEPDPKEVGVRQWIHAADRDSQAERVWSRKDLAETRPSVARSTAAQ